MVFPVSYIILMFHMASHTNVLGVRRGVNLAASFRLSLHCMISLWDGDPSLPRWVFWSVVADAFVPRIFLWVGSLALHQPLYPPGELVMPFTSYDIHGRAVGLFYTQSTGQCCDIKQAINNPTLLFLSLLVSVCLCFCLWFCLSVCLPACVCVCLSTCLPACLSV